jgi:hypothetical protein
MLFTLYTAPAGRGDSVSRPPLSAATDAAIDWFVSFTSIDPVPAPVESLQAARPNDAAAENAITARRFDLNIAPPL